MSARKQIIPIFIPHLGCPHECVFCNQKRISGSLLPATPADVVREVESALERLPESAAPQLAFYGGSFTAMPESEQTALLDAAQPYLKSGRISDIRLSTRPDTINEEILEMLRSSGVGTIELGTQSMVDEVLFLSGRGHTAQETADSARLIRQMGFELVLQMMTGLPGSSPERDVLTAQRIIELAPNAVRIYPTVIVRDTELCDMWQRGEYAEHRVEDAVELCSELLPMFENAGISVIRLGLNPTDELSGGAAVAGAYHPAFGELVKSRILLKKAVECIGENRGDTLIIGVHWSDVSAMTGQKRANIQSLRESLGFKQVKVQAEDVKKGEISIRIIAK